ncbi:MAG TPA: hypothetical protein VLA76_05545 [Candidatus Angelobacter sp.]|nr:hypothetical protein [Candidatus Angelobacter sp.]
MPSILTTNLVQGVAFVLFLVALPLISFGSTGGNDSLWWIGLGLLVVAGVLPPITRFVPLADEDEDEAEAGGQADGDAEADETEGERKEEST